MELETQRLIIRPWQEDDLEALYLQARDPEIGPLCGWKVHESIEESDMVLHEVLMRPDNAAVCYKLSSHPNQPIGSVGLTPGGINWELPADEGEIGYWLARLLWGHGLGTEAAGALLRYGFEDLGLKKIYAAYFADNERSHHVMEKLGMRYVRSFPAMTDYGTQRKEYMGISRNEWIRNRYR